MDNFCQAVDETGGVEEFIAVLESSASNVMLRDLIKVSFLGYGMPSAPTLLPAFPVIRLAAPHVPSLRQSEGASI